MATQPKVTAAKSVGLRVEYGQPNFKWQMVFNAFTIERISQGCMVKLAYVTNNGGQFSAAEIVPIIISSEGLEQTKQSAKEYIAAFADVPPYLSGTLPSARQFSPLFSNHIRLSFAGNSSEIAFFTVLLTDIANATKGVLAEKSTIPCVHVALAHSDNTVHRQLVLELMKIQ
jgi:hypothetical protein